MAIRARDERQTVESLKEKRSRGEKLTDAKKRMIAYSPFGTKAPECRCGSR